jgi:phosphoketolase
MLNRIKQWWRAEGALVGLQGMSDRMLADMGLDREDLRQRVLGQAAPEAEATTGIGDLRPALPCRC